MSTATFALVSESSEVIPGAAVVAVVRNIVEPAPGLMEVVELEAVDSCDVDFTEGATDTVPGADAVVVDVMLRARISEPTKRESKSTTVMQGQEGSLSLAR